MGDPARSQSRLRRRHGRRAGDLPEAARSRSSSGVLGRDLQAVDRRDARPDPAQARTTRSSRLRIPAQRRRQPVRMALHAKAWKLARHAESELAVLTTQCLSRRIPDKPTLEKEVAAWQSHRNKRHAKADWQFTTENARVKLKRL